MLSIVEWGIGMGLLEFLSKAADREHCIHTSAYPRESAHKFDYHNFTGRECHHPLSLPLILGNNFYVQYGVKIFNYTVL